MREGNSKLNSYCLLIIRCHRQKWCSIRKYGTQISVHCILVQDNKGRICLDILKKSWSPALQMKSVLLSIQSLLAEPNPDDPLNNAAADEWRANRKEAEAKAREYTHKYAKWWVIATNISLLGLVEWQRSALFFVTGKWKERVLSRIYEEISYFKTIRWLFQLVKAKVAVDLGWNLRFFFTNWGLFSFHSTSFDSFRNRFGLVALLSYCPASVLLLIHHQTHQRKDSPNKTGQFSWITHLCPHCTRNSFRYPWSHLSATPTEIPRWTNDDQSHSSKSLARIWQTLESYSCSSPKTDTVDLAWSPVRCWPRLVYDKSVSTFSSD